MVGEADVHRRGLTVEQHFRRHATLRPVAADDLDAGLVGFQGRVDAEENLILIRGAVPGPNGGYVLIRKTEAHKL